MDSAIAISYMFIMKVLLNYYTCCLTSFRKESPEMIMSHCNSLKSRSIQKEQLLGYNLGLCSFDHMADQDH